MDDTRHALIAGMQYTHFLNTYTIYYSCGYVIHFKVNADRNRAHSKRVI
jgi:hypothetical protein